jgi:hypothetical protein
MCQEFYIEAQVSNELPWRVNVAPVMRGRRLASTGGHGEATQRVPRFAAETARE